MELHPLIKLAIFIILGMSSCYAWCLVYMNDERLGPAAKLKGDVKFMVLWVYGIMSLFAMVRIIKYFWEM